MLIGVSLAGPTQTFRTKRPLKVMALYPYTINPYMVYEPETLIGFISSLRNKGKFTDKMRYRKLGSGLPGTVWAMVH